MEKEFIGYNEALALKELGFDEPCFATIDQTDYLHINGTKKLPRGSMMYDTIDCPTFSQAFRWFREKYNLKGHVEAIEYFDETPDTYHWSILNECNSGNDQLTYEEAELECLVKLIEIVKNK